MNFASDNVYGVDPRILAALSDANDGTAASYGADELTKQAEARLSEIFGTEVKAYLVTTGTAANGLALSSITPGYGAILCHAEAHISCDECNSPEFFTGGAKITPVVSIVSYFDLFVNVMLGIGVTFELPVLIFFLTMLRIVTPGFLIEHSRYAILAITILAAFITPTPDIVNLLIFAVPMILLYFVGVFAGYLLVLSREGRKFPWHIVFIVAIGLAMVSAAAVYAMVNYYGFKLIQTWPYLTK